MAKGRLIVIEGSDGSGKATQIELLKKAFVESVVFDFPRYKDNIYGELVGRYLKGEFGNLSPYFASLPFAMDRALAKPQIEQALRDGRLVLCNRYVSSNKAHMGANLPSEERAEFFNWLDRVEYEVNGLPKPDLTIFLQVSPDIGQKNITGEKDIHEKSLKHLTEANKIYQDLANSEPNWKIVECSENDQMKSPEIIHQRVMEILLACI